MVHLFMKQSERDFPEVYKNKRRKISNRYQSRYVCMHLLILYLHRFFFDRQSVFLEISLEGFVKNGILQKTPHTYIDNEFQISGWKILIATAV